MAGGTGWEPLRPPGRPSRQAAERRLPLGGPDPTPVDGRFVVQPFTRLVRVQAASAAGDAMVAVALAGSLFFSIDPGAARSRVALYLLLTLAPFVVVAPLVGPAVDRVRGGRRAVVVTVGAARALVAGLMALTLDNLALFPLAFIFLVLQKAYSVGRASIVPAVVRDDEELVEANAKLGVVGGVAGFAGAVPAGLASLLGSEWVLVLAALTFSLQAALATRLPRAAPVMTAAEERLEAAELHQPGVLLAASAMSVVRGVVGFLLFAIAFWFRTDDVATFWFGLALVASVAGTLSGNLLGAAVRRRLREESMLLVSLVGVALAGSLVALVAGAGTAALLTLVVGGAAATGRLAFDAIVQRDAPDAARGRAFARFETRFQLAWVAAAFVPVLVPMSGAVVCLVAAALSGVGAMGYVWGRWLLGAGRPLPRPVAQRLLAAGRLRWRPPDPVPPLPPPGSLPAPGSGLPPGAPLPPPLPPSDGRPPGPAGPPT
jgi:hypothetical protein